MNVCVYVKVKQERLLLYKKNVQNLLNEFEKLKIIVEKKIAQTILGADHEPIANEIKVRNF